jgi:hypothetical protein
MKVGFNTAIEYTYLPHCTVNGSINLWGQEDITFNSASSGSSRISSGVHVVTLSKEDLRFNTAEIIYAGGFLLIHTYCPKSREVSPTLSAW